MPPLPPDDNDPHHHLTKTQLHPVTDSSWIGQTVRGPYRTRSTVERVYATPFGVDVALCLHRASVYDTLRLEVTDMLSTSERPAAQRTAYLRNYRRLLSLHGVVVDGKATRRTHRAIQRRSAFWGQFHRAKVYVEAALLEGVQPGDRVVTNLGVQMTVTDPDTKRCRLRGWRTHMQVELTPQFHDLTKSWGWNDGHGTWPIRHEGWGLLPTFGLI
ncbi:hypothetical protein [Streptomyces sp. MZ04]|uniref:hypothetical protein n=1 Tax=Streptomyces sp. MZ04 TaxID=2559236 RepID=UPI00107EA157|nr:hypothetical protein [Streptomyces sp. MZ04]TGB07383.1 hypothetical protein E2651_21750 [Streptomyces sp. MZ04]